MQVNQTKLHGCLLIQPEVHGDQRGFFLETYRMERYKEIAGIELPFVQDNHSRSTQGILRGLHFQKSKPQGKLARVVQGEVYDVALDIRPESPTFGQWEGHVLSGENKLQFWMPPGLAHGFLVLSEYADFEYKCTEYYDAQLEGTIFWNDPALAIDWPQDIQIRTSEKDANAPLFKDLIFD